MTTVLSYTCTCVGVPKVNSTTERGGEEEQPLINDEAPPITNGIIITDQSESREEELEIEIEEERAVSPLHTGKYITLMCINIYKHMYM